MGPEGDDLPTIRMLVKFNDDVPRELALQLRGGRRSFASSAGALEFALFLSEVTVE